MAFNLSERFPSPAKSYKLLEPGAYQNTNSRLIRPNKVPFLSKSPRGSETGAKIWTQALYNADLPQKIPNCSCFFSKLPRFPYETLSEDDIEAILCQCGFETPCECTIEEEKEKKLCQGNIQRQLFKGPAPKADLSEGLSAPSKRDHGFKILPDGNKIRIFKNVKDNPPFYDARVIESTSFYQGCKWSKRTSQRDQKHLEVRPGPAEYFIENKPSYIALCAEKVRALKRKMSKQYRFIEMVQRRDILEGRPGPANYTLNLPKGTNLKWLGPRAERFNSDIHDVTPGPTQYCIKRDFDKIEAPQKVCHAKLPAPAFFGIKALRFQPQREQGPSPASYNAHYMPCQSKYDNVAPFGSFTKRFKERIIEDEVENELLITDTTLKDNKTVNLKKPPTWGFRSKTLRMKPLVKKFAEPSPADFPQTGIIIKRSNQLQYNCPFFSSEGRFQPWFNWIPIHGKDKTPGPGYYCLDTPKCLPAVNCGPLCRTQRFPLTIIQTPAPNAYRVDRGIENILTTHNYKLKCNIANKHRFHWSPPIEPKKLSLEEQESVLLNKSIALLDVRDIFEFKKFESNKSVPSKYTTNQTKLLRCFLQTRQTPTYF